MDQNGPKESEMVAYAVFMRERLRSPEKFQKYYDEVASTFEGHPVVHRVSHGALDFLEGPPTETVVILEFPTAADARAWYDSPAYVALRENRFLAGDYRAFIVQGV
jgi:uncharacterized protein (DUF1330 family)